jgi:hypothetical protein
VLFDTLLDQHLGKLNKNEDDKEKKESENIPLSKSNKEGDESSQTDDDNVNEGMEEAMEEKKEDNTKTLQ